jgi:prepilin-type N-terminal cleavage/methylation domain-containing protein
MEFKLTPSVKRSRRAGFTLVEYMVAMGIGLLAMSAALVLWAYGTKTCASLLNYVDLSNTSKIALDRMSQQIRNAKRVQSCSANKLVLLVPGASATNLDTVTFAYDASQKTLKRTITNAGVTNDSLTLLTGCSNFQFSVYQRTPISNSFGLYTNAFYTNTAKVIQMKWTCLRELTGDKSTIENQVAAKVVMRNP